LSGDTFAVISFFSIFKALFFNQFGNFQSFFFLDCDVSFHLILLGETLEIMCEVTVLELRLTNFDVLVLLLL